MESYPLIDVIINDIRRTDKEIVLWKPFQGIESSIWLYNYAL